MSFHNFYYLDSARRVLWILPPKCASTSIKEALEIDHWVSREVALSNRHLTTIAFVRHPFDRIVSALFSCLREYNDFADRYEKFKNNSHIVPQAPFLEGFRIDYLGRYENLAKDWEHLQSVLPLPGLPVRNVGKHRPSDWRSVDFDWSAILPRYQEDLALCPDWHS